MSYTPKFYFHDSTIDYLKECYDNDGLYHMILRLKEHIGTCTPEPNGGTSEELENDLLEQVMQAIG